ncbi:type IV pilus twitching motility protein PilT [Bythopirellula polymerisocia]|uniref:Twitching mobility protein n=1 Tax=Bythopirellula polymerisocia TaxID=2528003 RepID=A0A5C6CK09_9BACT|nr:PilT/PilU family type 4a pilus ATPase [Bythopirellula polymerisocia]TWU24798.1 Twitching mobility protein [Bythopirellula polymerisocia]
MELLPPEEEIQKLLTFVSEHEASDLHLKVGYPPYVRIGGHLRKLQLPELPDASYLDGMFKSMVPHDRWRDFENKGSVDFSAAHHTGDRFRINLFRSRGEIHAAIRRVQAKILNFNDLNLPDVYRKMITETSEGLVLVCGVTGSGKSSTLAAMLEHINLNRSMHIITIEDPIEFAFHGKKSIISQREVGLDVPNFQDAMRVVVRQDPDVILIGEMRDRETMLAAIQAAETGHLVMGSLHCADAQLSFSRILEFFERSEHSFIRSSLSNSLKAIMCQRLLPALEEGRRYPATEVLLINSIVKDKILHEEDEDLPALLHQCRAEGMREYTHSLCELVLSEKISRVVALDAAPNREALLSALKGIDSASSGIISRLRK